MTMSNPESGQESHNSSIAMWGLKAGLIFGAGVDLFSAVSHVVNKLATEQHVESFTTQGIQSVEALGACALLGYGVGKVVDVLDKRRSNHTN